MQVVALTSRDRQEQMEIDQLIAAILEGDSAEASAQARFLTEAGVRPEQIVVGVEAAMLALDTKCTAEEFNLLEIMLSGRAVTDVMKVLYPAGTPASGTKGTVVVATLEGDVHDLGKSILKLILSGNGYRVVDCGVDCPLSRLVEVTGREFPVAVGVSGLITTIIPQVKRVRSLLDGSGLDNVKVLAGGAALKQCSAEWLDVDFVAESAFDGVHYLTDACRSRS